MSEIKTKILIPHKNGCSSLRQVKENRWSHVWHFMHIRFGRKNGPLSKGYYVWHIFRCNSITCDAQAAILENDVCERMKQS